LLVLGKRKLSACTSTRLSYIGFDSGSAGDAGRRRRGSTRAREMIGKVVV